MTIGGDAITGDERDISRMTDGLLLGFGDGAADVARRQLRDASGGAAIAWRRIVEAVAARAAANGSDRREDAGADRSGPVPARMSDTA